MTEQLSLFEKNKEEKNRDFPIPQSFITILEMTENEWRDLSINYSFSTSVFGDLIIGSTAKGVCYLAFEDKLENAIENMKKRFPEAVLILKKDAFQESAMAVFENRFQEISLHIKGTDFQFQVWNELLKIPFGELKNYGEIAEEMGDKNKARAVGTAIGKNPVAYIIPCHRVVPLSGKIGGYMWGKERKIQIINWEKQEK